MLIAWWIASIVFLALVLGSAVYCLLVLRAARQYLAVKPPPLTSPQPISILKPLAGADEGLEVNLRSFFEQRYSDFEILFAIRTDADPAAAVVRRLQGEYPQIPSRLILTGEPPYANAKVWSLELMMEAAAHEVLVMSDSDIRVTPEMLSVVASEFQDPKLGVSTCPYRAVPGESIWSKLEALGMNTEFLAGVLVARMLEGMKFALGPTIVARKQALREIGGFRALSEFLAEDFVMGNEAARLEWGVALSSYVIEHRIGSEPFAKNAGHRLRWNRSTRRSRPAGYIGQLFTNPLPLAFVLLLLQPGWWSLVSATTFLRFLAARATAINVLRDPLTSRLWWLVPVQDLLSFVFWVAGFFGNTIEWRGRRYYVRKDGRFQRVG
jgi:ceramide glucosyltransferase